jgi:hypothetical protein
LRFWTDGFLTSDGAGWSRSNYFITYSVLRNDQAAGHSFGRRARIIKDVSGPMSANETDLAIEELTIACEQMAEGVGFEPTVGLTPRSISSRVP